VRKIISKSASGINLLVNLQIERLNKARLSFSFVLFLDISLFFCIIAWNETFFCNARLGKVHSGSLAAIFIALFVICFSHKQKALIINGVSLSPSQRLSDQSY